MQHNRKRISWDLTTSTGADIDETEVVYFNIGGVKYQSTLRILERYPNTEFSKMAAFVRQRKGRKNASTPVMDNHRTVTTTPRIMNNLHVDNEFSLRNGSDLDLRTRQETTDDSDKEFEFYVDRDPECFAAILNYLRTGKLHHPSNICSDLFRDELRQWRINEHDIQLCCVNDYSKGLQAAQTLRYFSSYLHRMAAEAAFIDPTRSRLCYWRQLVWKIMMVPTYSIASKIYSIITSLLILANCIVIMIQSDLLVKAMPLDMDGSARKIGTLARTADGFAILAADNSTNNNITGCPYNHGTLIRDPTTATLFRVDVAFSILFSIEIVFRFLTAPTIKSIMYSVTNWVEMIALFPYMYVVRNVIEHNYSDECLDIDIRTMRILFLIRIVRVYRIIFMISHYDTFRGFVYTLKSSLREFLMLFSLVAMVTVISGSLVSIVESAMENDDDKTEFENLKDGMWWALVTLTTVGYGDMVPKTTPGRLLTAVVSLSGITAIALATPMVSYNFNIMYTFMLGNHMILQKSRDTNHSSRDSPPSGEPRKQTTITTTNGKLDKVKEIRLENYRYTQNGKNEVDSVEIPSGKSKTNAQRADDTDSSCAYSSYDLEVHF